MTTSSTEPKIYNVDNIVTDGTHIFFTDEKEFYKFHRQCLKTGFFFRDKAGNIYYLGEGETYVLLKKQEGFSYE